MFLFIPRSLCALKRVAANSEHARFGAHSARRQAARERATAELRKRLEVAAPLLEAELARSPSAEARRRINALLAGLPNREGEQLRRAKAERALAVIAARKLHK
jgi:hypothetical protein